MPMKAQTIFNKVVKHLLTQNKRAFNRETHACEYLTKDGLRCAVGCLIPKTHPASRMEDADVTEVFNEHPDLQEKLGNEYLLSDLQKIHDFNKPSLWPRKLRALAKEEGLKYAP